jgi:hypothetical protein
MMKGAIVSSIALMMIVPGQYVFAAEAPNFTAAEVATINKIVALCIKKVHSKGDELSKHFDAFFNPSTGRVEYNAMFQIERESIFRFEKCMAESRSHSAPAALLLARSRGVANHERSPISIPLGPGLRGISRRNLYFLAAFLRRAGAGFG